MLPPPVGRGTPGTTKPCCPHKIYTILKRNVYLQEGYILMKVFKILAILSGVVALMLTAGSCEKKATNPGDTAGPAMTIDTMKAGNTPVANNDTVLVDSIVLKGHVNDPGGVDKISSSLGGVTVPVGDSVWTLSVFLNPGLNTITVIAEDNANNTTSISRKIYYRANYLPLDSGSRWNFLRGNDTLSIKGDSVWKVDGMPFRFFKMVLNNQDDGVRDTLIYAQDTVSGNVRASDSGAYQAMLAPVIFF